MKICKIKSAKRILSLCLALVLLMGSLFTANVGINITAKAENVSNNGTIEIWDGATFTEPTDSNGDGVYEINTAEELAWVCIVSKNTNSYKVADGISAFVMQNYDTATAQSFMQLEDADAVKAWFESGLYTNSLWQQTTSGEFQGTFDGNNATVYGMYCNEAKVFGLFPYANGATIKNVTVKNSYGNVSGSYAGAIFGRGNWSGTVAITVENCVVANNYMCSTTALGTIGGHAAGNPVVVRNCLIVDNKIDNSGAWIKAYVPVVSSTNAESGCGIYNTISNDSSRNGFTTTTYENVYVTYAYTAYDGLTALPADSMKGVSAKINMTGLNWATDTTDGDWYAIAGDYPLPYKPEGWADLEVPDVWDGSAAEEFESGTGTKDDPYIIKTAAQLRKMVLDGGRIDTGKTREFNNVSEGAAVSDVVTVKVYEKAYYKVADGVTDIYLNAVVDGTLETIKAMAAAGTAINWTKGLFDATTFKADGDGDGIYDQLTAFRGEFDGNGVTIHGLYSTTVNRSWNCEGVGFVPALMDDAVIKNVTFDKAYVCNTSYSYAGIITTSLGYDDTKTTNYDIDAASSGNTQQVNGSTGVVTSVGIHNVTVSNSRVETKSSSGYGGVAGFVASHSSPVACSFTNCLFDDSNELVVPDGFSPSSGNGTGGFIVLGQTGVTHFYFENCVSLGAYPDNGNGTPVYTNCYTSEASSADGLEGEISEYSVETMPNLNWTQWSVDENGELAVTGKSVAYSEALNWNEAIVYTNESRWSLYYSANVMGNWIMSGARVDGTYINYEGIQGSGTEDDPYLISDALTLARAIGSGGKNYTEKLYFKLTNDIDVGGLRWITTEGYTDTLGTVKYTYVPFEGVLDGDGYAVTNLYANSTHAGLIPELKGGTVKNLHIRNAYIVGGAPLIGYVTAKGTVDICSVEDSKASATNYIYAASGRGITQPITNSYVYCDGNDVRFYDAEGALEQDVTAYEADGEVWYQGYDGTPRLVNRAKAMTNADITGDGVDDSYGAGDLSALQGRLLKLPGYENVYGDVSKNGKVNSSDLVILKRAINDDYNHLADGFWRNVALGNIAIYYGENDNYDAARKLELYLEEAVPSVDVDKIVMDDAVVWGSSSDSTATYVHQNDYCWLEGALYYPIGDGYDQITDSTEMAKYALDGKLEIIVGNIDNYSAYATNDTATADNTYAVTYDAENVVLWLQGANFTAVEQAVLDFIANSDAKTNVVHTAASTVLDEEKQPRTVGGTTYYYAWGDEFDVATSDGSLTKDVWEYGQMGTEYTIGATSKYMNLVTANTDDLAGLYEVANGKLTIWRGLDESVYDEATHSWGYKPVTHTEDETNDWGATVDSSDIYASAGDINTQRGLLVKQGYLEMKASLPNDGHSFPAWWLYGAPSGGQNRTYDTSLYGKVYKLNPNWTGINAMKGAYPNSYKYQIPTAYLEQDMVELMQDLTYADEFGKGSWWDTITGSQYAERTLLTGTYRTAFNLTVHKWYEENVDDDILYVIDWDSWLSSRTAPTQYTLTDDGGTFNTSVSNGKFITRWGTSAKEIEMSSLTNLATEHVYGYKWVADESDKTFKVTVYVDGVEMISFDQSEAYYETAEAVGGTYTNDAEVYNQYVHFVLDNHFYSANQYYTGSKTSSTVNVTNFTDLLTQEDGESTTFEIDYIRVYQEDGKRDIVTKETEAFNNGNHFGYGE